MSLFDRMVYHIARDLTRSIPELEDMELNELHQERMLQVQDAHIKAHISCSVIRDMTGGDAVLHGHRCEACGQTWTHCDAIRITVAVETFHDAHRCPGCGAPQYIIEWEDDSDYDDDS